MARPGGDPTARFSSRAEGYARFRPGYPPETLTHLETTCGLSAGSVVADVGSGTGILTEALLERGYTVLAVEPNREMRREAEARLGSRTGFRSVDGRAEATSLPAASVDLVTAAQAFHWFDRTAARLEFARVLKPDGWVALIWNQRRKSGTEFLDRYEALLRRWSVDYAEIETARVTPGPGDAFFAPGVCSLHVVPNRQRLSWDALRGRLESASYTPAPGHPSYLPMVAELGEIFAACATAGLVTFEYDTATYLGRLR